MLLLISLLHTIFYLFEGKLGLLFVISKSLEFKIQQLLRGAALLVNFPAHSFTTLPT